MINFRWFFFTASIVLPCFFLPAFLQAGTEPEPEPLYGGQLTLSAASDPKSFNPILAKESSTTELLSVVFDGLTVTDPFDSKVKPGLAERWEFSADGLTCTFYLREGLRWSDGQPVTADDVVFTFNDLIFNEAVPNSARDIFTIDGERIQVEKTGLLAVKFSLPSPFAPFLRSMGQEILPCHILKSAVNEGRFNFVWGIDSDVRAIIGTGPYRIEKYVPGQKVVYVKNPWYWKKNSQGGALPYISRLVYLILPGSDIGLLRFLEGSLDIYHMRGTDYAFLAGKEAQKKFTIYNLGPDMGSSFIIFNQNQGRNEDTKKFFVEKHKLEWFKDVRFRKAVAYAVDKQRMIDIVKNGLGYPQYSPESPGAGFFYCDAVQRYDYDLTRARELLSLMGFEDRNSDGVLEDKDGHLLEFTLLTNADNDERVSIAEILRHDLENIGMKVHLRLVEFNTLVAKLTSTYDWDAVVLGLTGGVDPHFGQNVWLSSGQLHMWNPRQALPSTEWEKEIDRLFAMGAKEMDDNKRKAYYDEFQKIAADNLPLIYTVLGARIAAVRNRFGNLRPAPLGGVFHNLEEVFIRD